MSPRRRQDFEHSFKKIRRTDPYREIEESEEWKRDLGEEIEQYETEKDDVAVQPKED